MTNEDKFISVKDIRLVCDPWKDHGVKQYTAKEIADALSRDRWISVEERLPEENGFYLVKVGSSYNPVRVYRYEPDEMFDGNLWRGNDGSYMFKHFVTHWRPLPEPPKEETDA